MTHAKRATLLLSVVAILSTPAFARRPRGNAHKTQGPTGSDPTEEQYEAGLADVCDQRDQERSKAAAAGKPSFYSEECMPISIENRRAKRQGEKKHASTCESYRKEQRDATAKRKRVHLARDCFNLVPDADIEVDMPEPADPIYSQRPPGVWKSVKFFSCAKSGTCTPIAAKSPDKSS